MDTFTEPDPAERRAFNRLASSFVGGRASACRHGLWIAVEVRDRVSDRMRQDTVVIPTVAGQP